MLSFFVDSAFHFCISHMHPQPTLPFGGGKDYDLSTEPRMWSISCTSTLLKHINDYCLPRTLLFRHDYRRDLKGKVEAVIPWGRWGSVYSSISTRPVFGCFTEKFQAAVVLPHFKFFWNNFQDLVASSYILKLQISWTLSMVKWSCF